MYAVDSGNFRDRPCSTTPIVIYVALMNQLTSYLRLYDHEKIRRIIVWRSITFDEYNISV